MNHLLFSTDPLRSQDFMKTASEIKEFGITEGEDFTVIKEWGSGIQISSRPVIWDLEDMTRFRIETFMTLGKRKVPGVLEFIVTEDYIFKATFFKTLIEDLSIISYILYTKNHGTIGGKMSFKAILKIAEKYDDAVSIDKCDGHGTMSRWVRRKGMWVEVDVPQHERDDVNPLPKKIPY
jgi:hypothetical protein